MSDGEEPASGVTRLKNLVLKEVAESAGYVLVIATLPAEFLLPMIVASFIREEHGVISAGNVKAELNQE
jgi:hypothetical protein